VFRCEKPDEIKGAIKAALSSSKPALVEAIVDAEEKPTKPEELKA
jgi:thiamine pyrophosphate-dependent acetolactate synthase large subunit-like protein